MAFNKTEYNSSYNKAHYVSYSFRLNTSGDDADLIKHLKAVGSLKPYLCHLIRKDMKEKARKSRYIINYGSGSYEHNHIKQFPYEIIEDLPGDDHYSIGYAETIDDAALLIMNYVERSGTSTGRIRILQRFVDSRLGCPGAKEI